MAIIKICGIRDVETGLAAARAGADLVGLVFVQKSARFVSPEDAPDLITDIKQAAYDEGLTPPRFVGLFVDPGERLLAEVAPYLAAIQLHGHETPERVHELGSEFALDMIKAIPVGAPDDVIGARAYDDVADMLLYDARPPRGADLTGGNGVAFDWSLLASHAAETPFLVAGGLNPDNVGTAIKAVQSIPGFSGVDVSSGVEAAPGKKDPALIEGFTRAARAAFG